MHHTSNLQDDFKEKETYTLQEESEGDSETLWSRQFMNPIQKKQYYLYHFCAFHGSHHYDDKNYNYPLSHRNVEGKNSPDIL